MESIIVSREEFNRVVKHYGGDYYGPDYNRCSIVADLDVEGPQGPVVAVLICNALLRKGGKFYYGRADLDREEDGYNLVEIKEIQVKGKGARSFYKGTWETVYSRVEREILALVQ